MTDTPKYVLRRNRIVMVCDSPQTKACAEMVLRSDRGGGKDSLWWGHPSVSSMPDGTSILSVPVNAHNICHMYEYGAVADMGDEMTAERISFFKTVPQEHVSTLPLRPFQADGVRWLLGRNLCGCLSFGVGLGKTITALAALAARPDDHYPAIVLAPAHVKLNWVEEEWVKWGGSPDEAVCLFGRTPKAQLLEGRKLIVLNHHILAGWVNTLVDVGPKALLIDEAHTFVGHRTKTYPLVERLARACGRHVMLITATPLVNDLGDMWSLMNLINEDILGTRTAFEDAFMPEEKVKVKMLATKRWRGKFAQKQGWAEVGKARLPKLVHDRRVSELRDVIFRTVMLRRVKSEVIDQLPSITETYLRIDIPTTTEEGKKFWKINKDCAERISSAKEDVLDTEGGMVAFGEAKRAAAFAKLPDAEEWIRTFLIEGDVTDKLIVVGWSVEPLERLHKTFKRESVIINGSVEAREKKLRAMAFEHDNNKRILFGNVKSIGTGINLVAASTMLFLELPMTAVDLEQTKGRIDRISQKSSALSYYYMTVRNSVEEKRGWRLIRRKKELSDKLGV